MIIVASLIEYVLEQRSGMEWPNGQIVKLYLMENFIFVKPRHASCGFLIVSHE